MKKLLLLLSISLTAFAQSYPSSVYTPLIAKDNVQTTLSQAMAVGDTTAFVASTTGWQARMIAYICEASSGNRCTSFEVMLVTAVPSSNALTVTRGYGGTSAIAHASGKTVSNSIASIYNKTLSDEVFAIETALGPNLSNVALQSPFYKSSTYSFTPQSPGGSLGVGVNAIVLSPMPSGLAIGNYLWITGGVGTAEDGEITGVSGSTVFVNCANTHTGAWTIGPASDGIQEAIEAAPSGGTVYIPAGLHTQNARKINITKPITIIGDGESSVIVQQTATMSSFYVVYSGSSSVQFRDLKISYTTAGTKTAGSGIVLDAPVGLVNERTVIERVVFENQFIGLDAIRAGYWISRDNICSSSNSPNSTCHKVQDLTNADAGDQVVTGLYVGGAATGGVGIRILSGNGIKIHNNKFNNLNGGYVGTGKAISFEGATGYQGAIISSGNSFDQSGTCDICSDGLGAVSDIEIIGNQFNGGYAPVNSSGQINLIAGRVTIVGNTFIPRNAASAVNLTGVSNVVTGNSIDGGSGACVTIGAGSTHNNINANNYLNCTGVTNNSGNALNYIAVQKEGNFLKSTFPGSLEIATTAGQPLIIATDTTPIPHLTGQLLLYAGGSQVTDAHAEAGTCILGTNCAAVTVAFTNNTSYYCTASDVTSAAAVRIVRNSGVSVTFTGTGTDTLMWMCVGK